MNSVPSTAYSQECLVTAKTSWQYIAEHEPVNVIIILLRYGQLVPVKVLRWQGTSPLIVCTRWGGLFCQGSQGFYKPVIVDKTISDYTNAQLLIQQPWIFSPRARIVPVSTDSNHVETLDDVSARYRNK